LAELAYREPWFVQIVRERTIADLDPEAAALADRIGVGALD
jgi:hypothetical protein